MSSLAQGDAKLVRASILPICRACSDEIIQFLKSFLAETNPVQSYVEAGLPW